MPLVVLDSNEVTRARLVQDLTRLDLSSVVSHDLASANESCLRSKPDALLCGLSNNETQAMKWAQEMAHRHPDIPVVIVTFDHPLKRESLLEAYRGRIANVIEIQGEDDGLGESLRRFLDHVHNARSESERKLEQYARDLSQDQRAGHYVQMRMLPPNPMAIDRYRLQHQIFPSLLLSGDFVDYFRVTDDHFCFYVADVSGHGASSAFVTVVLKNFSRRLRREYRPTMLEEPGEILVWLNRELLENHFDKHVAMFVGVINLKTNTLAYANAGHFPPAMKVSEGKIGEGKISEGKIGEGKVSEAKIGENAPKSASRTKVLQCKGKPIGLFKNVSYQSDVEPLEVGESIVVMSDGVLEVLPAENGLLGKERLLQDAVNEWDGSMASLWTRLAIDTETPGPDDMTCLVVTRES